MLFHRDDIGSEGRWLTPCRGREKNGLVRPVRTYVIPGRLRIDGLASLFKNPGAAALLRFLGCPAFVRYATTVFTRPRPECTDMAFK